MIHPKVAAQTITGLVTGVITMLLVNLVPAWHNGIPSDMKDLITLGVTVVLGFAAGWLKKAKVW